MRLGLKEVTCEKFFNLDLSKEAITIIKLLLSEDRIPEKPKPITIPSRIGMVYTNCLGDMMDHDSSNGYCIENIPEIIFIDPYSTNGVQITTAHEVIHFIQHHLYFIDGLFHYDDWTEIQARKFAPRVAQILFVEEGAKISLITDVPADIEVFLEGILRRNPLPDKEIAKLEADMMRNYELGTPVEDYFQNNLRKHLNIGDFPDDEDNFDFNY